MGQKSRARILVVDDVVDVADSYALLLELWGYGVKVCYDGAKALEAAPAYRPRVVLLDIGLPGLDGFKVAQRLRDQPEFAGTVIIGCTGHTSEAYRARARECGFDHYLVKPVALDHLQALLRRAVRTQPRFALPNRSR